MDLGANMHIVLKIDPPFKNRFLKMRQEIDGIQQKIGWDTTSRKKLWNLYKTTQPSGGSHVI